jgi:xylan 1,4-beta-xylosidase
VPMDVICKDGVRGAAADVSALASFTHGRLCVLAWHYHDDDVAGPDAQVELKLTGIPRGGGDDGKTVRITQYRIDENHSNAYTLWKKFDSTQAPTPEQYQQLQKAGDLATFGEPATLTIAERRATLRVTLPRQAVALFVIEPA